ncbi:MAG: hypothetical protein JWO52_4013, partial [Gammaproteobacteria bacterium]|nr:hypothetical protein [Gammaproteobacteria bacterium]
SRIRDIVAETRMPFEPHQSLVGCIMNTRLRLLSRERYFCGRQRARFMSLLRETLAATIERGEPLPTAPAQSRGPETPRHARTRE